MNIYEIGVLIIGGIFLIIGLVGVYNYLVCPWYSFNGIPAISLVLGVGIIVAQLIVFGLN